ncbi:MAG TPA: ATP-binding protein [Burkholderiaceae bacterium]|nr:ATP-binding protein [Burkholderiaceae bacterium]
MRAFSIRRRLLVALLGALLGAGLIAAIATYASARGEVDSLLDEELRQIALSLRDHAQLDLGRLQRASDDPELRVLVQIWDPAFERPYSSRAIDPLPRLNAEGFATLEHEGRSWRIYATPSRKQAIQVAQPTALRAELAARSAARLLLPVVIVLPFLGLLGWWIVGRGLAPLTAVARTLTQRDPTSLQPVTVQPLPIELQPLVESLNDLLRRLEVSFDTQRRFAADAAHELRTPLTALTLQVQLAARAQSDAERAIALERLEQGVKRATRLVQQLLTMARLDPEAAGKPAVPTDLALLAAGVVDEQRPSAAQKSITLQVDTPASAWVLGQEDALRILLTNLIDNAVRYTKPGGRVDVGVRSSDEQVLLSVHDNGPGIPNEERERVFDRFYRGRDAAAGGSGLGLAIVRQIARMHSGSVELSASPGAGGLQALASFPAVTPPAGS